MRRVATGPRSTFAGGLEARLGIGPGNLLDDLGEREVGDALAVRNAASDHDARLALERAQDLARKTGLADARRPDDRGEPARRLAPSRRTPHGARRSPRRPMNGVTMEREKAGTSGRRPSNLHAASGSDSCPSARTGDAARRRRRPDEAIGRLADEHPASGAALLESRRHVDRVARDELLVGGAVPTITSPVLTPVRVAIRTPYSREVVVHAGESLTHLERRSHCPNRIVFVHCGHAEHGHDRVADELLDRAAVPFERRLHRVEVTPSHAVATRDRAVHRARSSRRRP